jgi:hypothetical protein
VGDRDGAAEAFGIMGGAASIDGDHEDAAVWYRKGARRNTTSLRVLEDLCGLLRSYADAGKWPQARRSCDRVAEFSLEHNLQARAWDQILHAARPFLESNEIDRAAKLTAVGWAVASHASAGEPDGDIESDGDDATLSPLVAAMLFTAWQERVIDIDEHERFYDQLLLRLELDEHDLDELRPFIQDVRETVAKEDPDR